jgi:hypothetical protein
MLYSGQTVMLKSVDYAQRDTLCRQINIKTARKLYDKGVKIWLHPCNVKLHNAWQEPYHYQQSDTNKECFDSLINSFKYFNLDMKRGRRLIFFAQCNTKGKLIS